LKSAATVIGHDALTDLPDAGPSRDQWSYFLRRRISSELLQELIAAQRDLAITRACEVGLLNPGEPVSPGKYRREYVVGLDGKVFSSPLRTLDTMRANTSTGEIRSIRQDPARQRYGEGGVEGLALEIKFAIASVRSRLANHRVVLGIAHFDSTTPGEAEFREVVRHQTKRDVTHHKTGRKRHQFYGRYSLPCPEGAEHDWWEPLLATRIDVDAGFNRAEYLRVTPATAESHRRLYGMRQDTESLNAQLERAFYGQRLPAWGVHNQTTIVLFAALAENAWALRTWRSEVERQQSDPPAA
jgi:hypothetical protein